MKYTFFKRSLPVAFLVLFCVAYATAQGDSNTDSHTISVVVPSIALLDIETAGTRNFNATFVDTEEAGDKVTNPDDNTDLWLNYTSIITGSTTKKVQAALSAVVEGVTIGLDVATSSTGSGNLGTPAGSTTTLDASTKDVITAIGSAYTVSGPSKGHQLTYSFDADDTDFADLRSGTSTVTVTYTLVDE